MVGFQGIPGNILLFNLFTRLIFSDATVVIVIGI